VALPELRVECDEGVADRRVVDGIGGGTAGQCPAFPGLDPVAGRPDQLLREWGDRQLAAAGVCAIFVSTGPGRRAAGGRAALAQRDPVVGILERQLDAFGQRVAPVGPDIETVVVEQAEVALGVLGAVQVETECLVAGRADRVLAEEVQAVASVVGLVLLADRRGQSGGSCRRVLDEEWGELVIALTFARREAVTGAVVAPFVGAMVEAYLRRELVEFASSRSLDRFQCSQSKPSEAVVFGASL